MKIYTSGITKPPKICIFGNHGVGKSRFAASCPEPIFIQTEDRLAHLNVNTFELAKSHDDVVKALDYLLTTDHNYKTVVLDTVDWAEDLLFADVCAKAGTDNINHPKVFAYGAGYKLAAARFKSEILAKLGELNEKKKMLPVILSHFKLEYKEHPQFGTYQKFGLDLQGQLASKLYEFCDIVAFLDWKTSVSTVDQKTLLASTGQRVMRLKPQPFWETKESYNLPSFIDIPEDKAGEKQGWQALSAAIKAGISSTKTNGNLSEVKTEKEIEKLTKE